jgi:hypothetical protein
MRLEQYINEEVFAEALYDLSIYKNPTPADYKELLADDSFGSVTGFRVTVDMVKKNVYVSSDYIFHRDQMDVPRMKKELKFTWSSYWEGAPSIKRILMFNCDSRFNNCRSDSLRSLAGNNTKSDAYILELARHDRTWLKKYKFKMDGIDDIFDETLFYIADMGK